MLFNSSEYLAVFFPAVLLGCMLLRSQAGPRAAQVWILIASLVFYGWFKPATLSYLAASIVVNWYLTRAIGRARQPVRKRLMQLSLALNIGYLCVFKYVNFFLTSLGGLLHGFHLPDLDFPLGISFFTLMQIMCMVDVYQEILPAMNLFDYSTFVSFFPYVISGPIAKGKRMQHQFGDFGGRVGAAMPELIARGLFQFTIGLVKKVMLADVFAKLAAPGFVKGVHLSAAEALVFSVAYTLQIYLDFSGYSDMAIGSALMLGIEIPRNFDSPLRSKSIIEFWSRWHISLSQFITSYLYTPMLRAMGKATLATSALATFLAMCIVGLWHGPAWTFVIYGAINGAALGINQYWRKKKILKLPAFVSWLLTFMLFNVALIFFRSVSVADAARMTISLFNPMHAFGFSLAEATFSGMPLFGKFVLPVGVALAFFGKSSDELSRDFKPTMVSAFSTAGLFVSCCATMALNTSTSFLYFKF